jgi:phage/plasmid-associated DNA primase
VLCYQVGLGTCEQVADATQQYRENQDRLHDFLQEMTVKDAIAEVVGSVLFKAYLAWCSANDVLPLGKKSFNTQMRSRGYTDKPGVGNKATWYGIGLISEVKP